MFSTEYPIEKEVLCVICDTQTLNIATYYPQYIKGFCTVKKRKNQQILSCVRSICVHLHFFVVFLSSFSSCVVFRFCYDQKKNNTTHNFITFRLARHLKKKVVYVHIYNIQAWSLNRHTKASHHHIKNSIMKEAKSSMCVQIYINRAVM